MSPFDPDDQQELEDELSDWLDDQEEQSEERDTVDRDVEGSIGLW